MRKRTILTLVAIISFLLSLLFIPHIRNPDSGELVSYGFRLPLDGSWVVIQDFAEWNQGWCGYHLAEDVGRNAEVPICAASDGIVKFAGKASLGYGYVVVIEHKLPSGDPAGDYVCTVYGHLRKENLTVIGQTRKGSVVGYLSENPEDNGGMIHLHFGIRKGPYSTETQDPRRGGWYYGGYTTVFGECNKSNSIHTQILAEWVNPTTDPNNGEGFINTHP